MLRSHLLSSCVYLSLGHLDRLQAYRFVRPRLILAVYSGPGVAVVVSVNCFLPKFCSAFCRYLTLEGSWTNSSNGPAEWFASPQKGPCCS